MICWCTCKIRQINLVIKNCRELQRKKISLQVKKLSVPTPVINNKLSVHFWMNTYVLTAKYYHNFGNLTSHQRLVSSLWYISVFYGETEEWKRLWKFLVKQFIIFSTVPVNIHSLKAMFSIPNKCISPAFACVSDLSCSRQTNVPSVVQRNSLCSASSGHSWFSSLQRAGCREDADTVPTEMVHTEQRSLLRGAGWVWPWPMTGAACGELWSVCRDICKH